MMLINHLLYRSLSHLFSAYHLDQVNLQGFFVWRLQDRHSPLFGLFTSTQHQSKAKASVATYNQIITLNGFPTNNKTRPCSADNTPRTCSMCEWIYKNKVRLVFGGCVLITAATMAVLVVFYFTNRRNRRRDRRKKRSRLNWR